MTESDYANTFWLYADQQEDALQSYISGLDISDVIAQVFNRFAGVDLNKMLSMSEVVKLHRNVEKWLDNGLDERQYRLILQDIQRRKQIREREALAIWLLAAFSSYYAMILSKSAAMYSRIAADSYGKAFNDTRSITTGNGTPKPPAQAAIDALMKEANPLLRRTIGNQLWIETQYNRDTLLSRYNADVLAGKKFDPDTPENRRKFQSIEERLLKRSAPAGHHGILDQQMTFITGYTVIKAMKDAGAKRVKFIATIDERTTHACKWLNLKVFNIDELKLGVTAPPISIDKDGMPIPHPCRSFLRIVAFDAQEVASAIRSSGSGEQSKPHTYRQLGTIDRRDDNAVQSILEAFEKRFVNSQTEHCLVIAENGDVLLVDGDESTVDTSLLGERMKGSINIHNHPAEQTQYSFSDQDIKSFVEDGSKKMLAFDNKYIYEVERPASVPKANFVEEVLSHAWDIRMGIMQDKNIPLNQFEFEQMHTVIEYACKSFEIKYRRWNNE